MFDLTDLGVFIRERRLELNLTQEEVVERATKRGYPVSQATIAKLEGFLARKEPGGEILKGLMAALEVSPNQLFGYLQNDIHSILQHKPISLTIASLVDGMTKGHQEIMLTFAQKLAVLEEENLQQNVILLEETLRSLDTVSPGVRRKVMDIIAPKGAHGAQKGGEAH